MSEFAPVEFAERQEFHSFAADERCHPRHFCQQCQECWTESDQVDSSHRLTPCWTALWKHRPFLLITKGVSNYILRIWTIAEGGNYRFIYVGPMARISSRLFRHSRSSMIVVFASTRRLRDDELTRLMQWKHKEAGVGTTVRKDRLTFLERWSQPTGLF